MNKWTRNNTGRGARGGRNTPRLSSFFFLRGRDDYGPRNKNVRVRAIRQVREITTGILVLVKMARGYNNPGGCVTHGTIWHRTSPPPPSSSSLPSSSRSSPPRLYPNKVHSPYVLVDDVRDECIVHKVLVSLGLLALVYLRLYVVSFDIFTYENKEKPLKD